MTTSTNLENIEDPTAMKTVALETIIGPEILTPEGIQLPATHRCDKCKMQAWVEVEMPTTRVVNHINLVAYEDVNQQIKEILLFCAHHYRDHEDALKASASKIVDYRGTLVQQEKAGGPAL